MIPTLGELAFFRRASESEAHPLEEILGRRLTPTEKSAVEAMWSEHAGYGSSKFYIQTLLPTSGPNHVAAIGEEAAAAVIYVNPKTGKSVVLTYSSESHNGPSYVCPHPGAATGTGGNQRDNIAKTATKPDAVYEARRQGHPLHNHHGDPIQQHTDETTKGIGDYANAMGIPHGDGSIKFHPYFSGNNLVNVLVVSIVEKERLMTNKVPTTDDPEKFVGIYIGKASDTTGIGGTKFASVAIDMTQTDLNEKAVQDPDPHLQEAVTRGIEKVVDLALREGWKDKISLKDMGAAGLLCSSVEQLHGHIGVIINGDLVPQNQPRTALELLEAETQERFFIYVHEDYAERILDIFNREIGLPFINKGAQAAIVGRCNSTGKYKFVRQGVMEVDLPVRVLTEAPLLKRPVKSPKAKAKALPLPDKSLEEEVLSVLGSINFKSDAYVHDHYDKHVRSTNIVNRGEGTATLRTHPLLQGKVGYSVSFDANCVYGILDPAFQAEDSLVRAAYKMALVGCSVIGVSNNANFGRTTVPEEMWQFVSGQEGVGRACYNWNLEEEYVESIAGDQEIALKFGQDPRRHVTVNGGNCSLNKANANTKTAIPPTTILGVIGWTNKPENYATWKLEATNSELYLIGARQAELGGSDYLQTVYGLEVVGDTLFAIDYEQAQREVRTIIKAVRSGLIAAGNNIEEGGLCNTVAELVAHSEGVGVTIDAYQEMGNRVLTPQQKLFSESYGVVVQVLSEKKEEFLKLMKEEKVEPYKIGGVFASPLYPHLSINQILIEKAKIDKIYHEKLEKMLGGRT
ncbi:hypothetical protein J4421_04360 [Candidatus Woesearchaeota archaeon]|nr:hypothetical protein [Candidatus Woesearchaeota archaeon]